MLDSIARLGQRGVQILQPMGNSGVFLLGMFFRKPDFRRLMACYCVINFIL